MKVNVLGTEYDFNVTTEKEDNALYEKDGYCDRWKKIIGISDNMHDDELDFTDESTAVLKYAKRHELFHAFLWESGLRDYTEDETLVEWLAIQFPKLCDCFKEVDAL